MGLIGQYGLNPFSRPVRPFNPLTGPDQIRGAINQLAKNLTDHDADASIHLVSTTTAGVTTSAVAIYTAIVHSAFGFVNGSDGAGKDFVDAIAWDGTSGTVAAVASTTTAGVPAARTYSVASGVLKLQMGSGTYTIVLVPIVFTT